MKNRRRYRYNCSAHLSRARSWTALSVALRGFISDIPRRQTLRPACPIKNVRSPRLTILETIHMGRVPPEGNSTVGGHVGSHPKLASANRQMSLFWADPMAAPLPFIAGIPRRQTLRPACRIKNVRGPRLTILETPHRRTYAPGWGEIRGAFVTLAMTNNKTMPTNFRHATLES